jgi:Transposase DDE domain
VVGGQFRQSTLWPLLRRDSDLAPGLREVKEFLDAFQECDGEIVDALLAERGHGRDDYPVVAMWGLIAVQLYLRKGKFSDLIAELRRNADLADLLGFKECLPRTFDVPDASAVSRMYKKLKSDRFQQKLRRLLQNSAKLTRKEDPRIGENTAEDCTDIRTHGHPTRHEGHPQKEKPATDPEASWSVKTKRWVDGAGKHEETKRCFGYKACLNVDVVHPVVLGAQTVSGSTSDHEVAIPVLEEAVDVVGRDTMQTCAEDKGFDSADNVREAYRDLGVAIIVPVRDVPEELEKLPVEDREVAIEPGGNVFRDIYTGEVACYERVNCGEPIRREMKYAGFEKDRETHKFRCPLAGAARTTCSAFGNCSAGGCGNQGRQVRVDMETDIRRFAPVYPRSKKWKRAYRGRTAAERVNSYVKEVLRLEDHCLRGLAAISLRVLLASVTLNIRTLLALRAAKAAKAAAARSQELAPAA